MSVLEIVFVGQCEVFVCLDIVLTFFFSPLATKLIGPQMGRQFFKNVDFSVPYPLKYELFSTQTLNLDLFFMTYGTSCGAERFEKEFSKIFPQSDNLRKLQHLKKKKSLKFFFPM